MSTLRTLTVNGVNSNGTRQAYPHGTDVDNAGVGPDNRDVFVGSWVILGVKAMTTDGTGATNVRCRIYDCADGSVGRAIRGGNEAAAEDRHPYVIDTTAGGSLNIDPATGSPFVGGSSAQGNAGRLMHDVTVNFTGNTEKNLVDCPVQCVMGMYVRLEASNQPGGTQVDFQITYKGDVSGATRKAARNFGAPFGGNIPL